MKTIAIVAATVAFISSSALAQNNANPNAPGQDRDCLITWLSAAEATNAEDAKAVSGKYLPRKAADAQASKSDGKSRVFDYSNSEQTRLDGTKVTIATNEDEQEFCEGSQFNR